MLRAVLLCLVAGRAHGQNIGVHVQVAAHGCPDAQLLERKLVPLLPAGAQVAIDASAHERTAAGHGSVEDRGDRYLIEIDGLRRELADPARDCVERARVAAVFIALNVREAAAQGQVAAGSGAAAPADAERETDTDTDTESDSESDSDTESDSESDSDTESDSDSQTDSETDSDGQGRRELDAKDVHLGVRVFGEASYATEIDRGVAGAGAGISLGAGALRCALTAGVLSAADVELAANSGVDGSVALTRIPLTLSASYLLAAGALAFGPSLGLAADLLRLRGVGVARAQTELRLDPGVLVGAELHAHVAPSWSVLLRFALSAFPRAYDLSVDPEGSLARTPRLWLGASFGAQWNWH